jgi:predicted metal-binding membrane protein
VIARAERIQWRHPELGAAAVALSGWGLLVGGIPHGHSDHVHHHGAAVPSLSSVLPTWAIVSAAMMVPSVLPACRYIAFRSPWRHRQRAVSVFLAAYLSVWVAFGVVATESTGRIQRLLGAGFSRWLLALALLVAAVWELTPTRRRSLRACHLIAPPPPHGWKAVRGCARAGFEYGRRCAIGCWALMLAMAVGGHASLPLMLVLTVVVCVRTLLVRGPRLGLPTSFLLLDAAAVVAGA